MIQVLNNNETRGVRFSFEQLLIMFNVQCNVLYSVHGLSHRYRKVSGLSLRVVVMGGGSSPPKGNNGDMR